MGIARPSPQVNYRPYVILLDQLKPGTVLAGTTPASQIITLANAISAAIRIKTNGAGTLSLAYVGPDYLQELPGVGPVAAQANAFGATIVAAHTTGAPANVAVAANTEAIMYLTSQTVWNGAALVPATYNGESYALLTFTPTAGATINYVTLAQIVAQI